jgi:hypothetical protein
MPSTARTPSDRLLSRNISLDRYIALWYSTGHYALESIASETVLNASVWEDDMISLKDQACIVSIGQTRYRRGPEATPCWAWNRSIE